MLWRIFSLLLIIAAATTVVIAKCPKNSHEVDSKCFTFISAKNAFFTAEYKCKLQYGGHLAAIHSAFDNAFVTQIASAVFDKTSDVWIGATNSKMNDEWAWTDGQALTFKNFTDEASSAKGSLCSALNLENGQWISADCYDKKPYICLNLDKDSKDSSSSSATTTAAASDAATTVAAEESTTAASGGDDAEASGMDATF
uniref:C-type lectin domain-containing protein n=1 Tax=Panagrolaimus sp. PS1159 TaxID=55785 RepID=A0AC35EWA9_9BILA